MEQKELNEIIKKHEKWLKTNGKKGKIACLIDEDLHGMNLSNVDLSYADLRKVNLNHAKLFGTDLSHADLSGADLSGADLSNADLHNAALFHADLSYAILSYAEMIHADMRHANLHGAELPHVNMKYADLLSVDLDFSSFPLWCGGLDVNIDDRQATQLLYHLIRNVNNSKNCSESMKKLLNTDSLVKQANKFHRIDDCGKIKVVKQCSQS